MKGTIKEHPTPIHSLNPATAHSLNPMLLARRCSSRRTGEEALLYYVIAFELLFGDRQAIQRSVAERVAVITFTHAKRSFEEQREWVNRIYEGRSRYIHAGENISDEVPLDELYTLAQVVFRCLMRLQAAKPAPIDRGEATLNNWVAVLDYLAKAKIAGLELDETKQLSNAFIL
jgi:Apea-like HEPN